jgi:hypothetical protein
MVRVQPAAPERTEDYGCYVARAVSLFEVKSQSRCKCSLRSCSTNTARKSIPALRGRLASCQYSSPPSFGLWTQNLVLRFSHLVQLICLRIAGAGGI